MKKIFLFNPYYNIPGGGEIVQNELKKTIQLSYPNTQIVIVVNFYNFILSLLFSKTKISDILIIEQGVFSKSYILLDLIIKLSGVKYIIIPRGDYIPNGKEEWAVSNKLFKRILWKISIKNRLKNAFYVIFTSSLEYDRYNRIGLSNKCKFKIIPDAFNHESRFSQSISNYLTNDPGFSYFLYVGRISVEKNILFLVESYSVFFNSFNDFKKVPHLVLFTPTNRGKYFDEVIAYIKKNNLSSHIHFYNENIMPLRIAYKNCIVNLLPSMIESFGLTVLEALIFKKYTVVSENVPWYYSKKDFVISAKLDSVNWAKIMQKFYDNMFNEIILDFKSEFKFYSADYLKSLWINLKCI